MPIANKKFVFIAAMALAGVGLCAPNRAECSLSAEAELNYVNYDVRDNSSRHLSASSFSQRYSLLYGKRGTFIDGRLGKYDVSLGYEWVTFDTSIKSTSGSLSPSASNGRIMYSGEVVLDPKEFPVKLHAYSRDLTRSSWLRESSRSLTTYTNNPLINDALVAPDFITSIQSGQHIESGATLVMGVKNGMTNGYNELLRHFPMLMLDYRDQVNKDYSSLYPVDNRLSRLAFVSLNKKDNWFHYRFTTYKDYINSGNNYNETQIQLGTIDHTMQRRWIDFANWLQVSADGQLSKRVTNNVKTNEEFALNLFATARRKTWEARTFNSFYRTKENNDLITYKTSIPLYVSGIYSPTATWNAYVTYSDNKTNKGGQFTTTAAGYQADAFSQSDFTLKHGAGVETAKGADIISAVLGTTSTPRFSRSLSLGADYKIRHYLYDGGGNFTSQSLGANARYIFSNQLSFMLFQNNNFTNGRSHAIGANVGGASTFTEQYYNPRNGSYEVGSTYQSITGANVSWNPLPRLNVSFTANEDIYASGGQRNTITTLENYISYSNANLMFTTRNLYSHGNSTGTFSPYNTVGQLSSQNTVSLMFSRNVDARLRFNYYRHIDQPGQPDQWDVEQNLNYYYFQEKGLFRKLFEINETFTKYSVQNNDGIFRRPNELTLGARYYPLRQLLIGGGTKYAFASRLDNYSMSYYGIVSLQYRLLEASLDYTYGKNTSDGRIEKKFMANFKKKF